MELNASSIVKIVRAQWCHLSAIIVSGMGFFTGAYNLFCIPAVSTLLGRLHYEEAMPLLINAVVNGITLCGLFIGHLFFGWLGDRMGRRKVYGMTLGIMIASSIGSGLSIGRSRSAVIASLCFFRFWLGVGIGGDYPKSATIMAEYANTKNRGAFMAAVFSMQAIGILTGSIVAMTVSACFKAAYPERSFGLNDLVWRIILMIGAVPAGFTFYWRMKMPESAHLPTIVAQNARNAAADMSELVGSSMIEDEANTGIILRRREPYGLFSKAFLRNHGRHLVGTMLCWFFSDITFYSTGLFQKDVYRAVGWIKKLDDHADELEEVFQIAKAQALIALSGTLPGCFFGILFIDRLGRRKLQVFGFFFMAVCLIGLSFAYNYFKKHWDGFLAVYTLTFFFSMLGPNATTLIVPAESFPARMRSTCHGISAAAGKVGAIIGLIGFSYASQSSHKNSSYSYEGYFNGIGMSKAFLFLGVASCVGLLCTFLVRETNGQALEDSERDAILSEYTSGPTSGSLNDSIESNHHGAESSSIVLMEPSNFGQNL
ncbi:hypothetical protein SUGI_0428450 [Cryptomeria japonica]|uniref:inorganic phosphate transporter 1-1 n=1 Tax=Cryptomeria japonica TaxID=3369 RepID=UPI002408DA01|nr:inorganic phosphate transporter 1-1 [Cryptomeria japonica]GLJ22742.1 hypothetical protein SUGI_0428450 [Cryptomeria japonica]